MQKPFSFLSLLIFFIPLLSITAAAASKTLVIVGDSLTEGYGVAREAAYPFVLEKELLENKIDWKVVNSGIGGSTSASAPARAKWILKTKPDRVILFLGGNDALRGLPPAEMKKNLALAIDTLKEAKIPVTLVEMWAPPNLGKDYTTKFRDVFLSLKKEKKIELIEFPLGQVAGHKELNQADGIHPNEKGHKMLADNIFKKIKGSLK